MKRAIITLASAGILMAGCAKNTSELPTSYVSPLEYQSYSCKQLIGEMSRINRRVNELAHSINKNAQGDSVAMGVGLVLFWPALFFIDGDTPEAQEYSRLKGEYEAVEKQIIKKGCDYDLPENPFSKIEKQREEKREGSISNINRRRR